MNGFRIITADERMEEQGGIKGVIFGPAKIGKTSLLWTLDPETTLFLDLEAGGLSGLGRRLARDPGLGDGPGRGLFSRRAKPRHASGPAV